MIALIDAIGPFFRNHPGRRINWSKIPFSHLATSGPDRRSQWDRIRADLDHFLIQVAALGYNTITLDDVAHLTDHEDYEPEVREQISVYRDEFRPLFALARERGCRVFVTSDYLATSPAMHRRLKDRKGGARRWFCQQIERFLDDFPEVEGIVLRIGESDGMDVEDAMRSRLLLRSARDVNRLLRELLPVFESRNRKLIFRTWTVGAYLIGDLIWHRGRVAQAFQDIESPALIVSMKYGESDFFRYLPLNQHFSRIDLPKIIEFQARPEYEGAGEYPSFAGWECENHLSELAGCKNLAGFSVWCQTGGWHPFRRLAFLDPEATWINLNAATIARLALGSHTVESAVAEFFGEARAAQALEFLRRSDIIIRNLLYIPEFARLKLYFRRVRIPPLIHVYWDCVFINTPTREIIRSLVHDHDGALRAGEAAFQEFERLATLAGELDLPAADIEFMRDTFELILLARRYYFLPFTPEMEIRAAKKAYKEKWPRSERQRYRIKTSFTPFPLRRQTLRWLVRLLFRRKRGYRTILDRMFTLNVLSWSFRIFHTSHSKALPKMMRKSAMGVESVFR